MADVPATDADLGDANRAAALMLASARFTEAEVCDTTGLSPEHLGVLRRSPLFQTAVERFRSRLYDEVRDRLMADLMSDAKRNMQFIEDAREGLISDSPQMLGKRLQAALALLDRQLPTKRDEAAAAGVQIVINSGTVDRFSRAFEEAKVVSGDD